MGQESPRRTLLPLMSSFYLHRSLRASRQAIAGGVAVLCLVASSAASAALFEDDEARRAILDVRQRVEAQRLANEREAEAQRQDASQLRRSMLELQTQIETLRGELARLHG